MINVAHPSMPCAKVCNGVKRVESSPAFWLAQSCFHATAATRGRSCHRRTRRRSKVRQGCLKQHKKHVSIRCQHPRPTRNIEVLDLGFCHCISRVAQVVAENTAHETGEQQLGHGAHGHIAVM